MEGLRAALSVVYGARPGPPPPAEQVNAANAALLAFRARARFH